VAEDARLVARRIVEEVLAARQRADGAEEGGAVDDGTAEAGTAAENGAVRDAAGRNGVSEADKGAADRAAVDPRSRWDTPPGPAVADELDERPSRAVARRIVEEVLAAHAAAARGEVQLPAPAAEAAGPPAGSEAVPLQPVPDRPAVVPGAAAAALGPDIELDPGPAVLADDAASIARRIVENVLAEAAVRDAEAREVEAREVEAREEEARDAVAPEGSAREARGRASDADEVLRETDAREAEARRAAARVAAARAAATPVAAPGDRPDAGHTEIDDPGPSDRGSEAPATAGTTGSVATPADARPTGGTEDADAHAMASDGREGRELDLELVREAEVREAQLRDAVLREAEAREARLRDARLASDDGPPPVPGAAAARPADAPAADAPAPVVAAAAAAGAVDGHDAVEAHGDAAGVPGAVGAPGDVDTVPAPAETHGDVDADVEDADVEDSGVEDSGVEDSGVEDADVAAPIFAPRDTGATATLPAVDDGAGVVVEPDDRAEADATGARRADPARPAARAPAPRDRGRARRHERTSGGGAPVGDEDAGGVAILSRRSEPDAEATTAVPTASPPAKRTHWLIVSIVGAIGLAVLLPLAIGALRSLVALS
jgi:hypothetical protein